MIYLDYAANTPASNEVLERFIQCEKNYKFNPNSSNPLAQETKQLLDSTIQQMCQNLKIKKHEIIFTSSATESNNLAIKGIAHHYKKMGKHIITTYLEHASVHGPIQALVHEGYEVDYVDLDEHGMIDIEHLKELLRPDTILVSICHVDSECGIIQPLESICRLIKELSKCYIHIDGTQAIGKIEVDLSLIDSYVFTAHKIHGINGIGALILKEHVSIEPLFHGGISMTPYRSGTPSLGLIESMSVALNYVLVHRLENFSYVQSLNHWLRQELSTIHGVIINSPLQSSPYVLNVSFTKHKSEVVIVSLAHKGICLSSKSACCAVNSPSHSVYALTKDKKRSMSTMRISLSYLTTYDELTSFLVILKETLATII